MQSNERMQSAWDWGQNCKVCGFGVKTAEKCIESFHLTPGEYDSFWEGFHAPKQRNVILPISGFTSKTKEHLTYA